MALEPENVPAGEYFVRVYEGGRERRNGGNRYPIMISREAFDPSQGWQVTQSSQRTSRVAFCSRWQSMHLPNTAGAAPAKRIGQGTALRDNTLGAGIEPIDAEFVELKPVNSDRSENLAAGDRDESR